MFVYIYIYIYVYMCVYNKWALSVVVLLMVKAPLAEEDSHKKKFSLGNCLANTGNCNLSTSILSGDARRCR